MGDRTIIICVYKWVIKNLHSAHKHSSYALELSPFLVWLIECQSWNVESHWFRDFPPSTSQLRPWMTMDFPSWKCLPFDRGDYESCGSAWLCCATFPLIRRREPRSRSTPWLDFQGSVQNDVWLKQQKQRSVGETYHLNETYTRNLHLSLMSPSTTFYYLC
jgi:hypothetical protein